MGFFKNIGVQVSPMYTKFLTAKEEMKLTDGSTVLNIMAEILYLNGYLYDDEYKSIRDSYFGIWGTCWNGYPGDVNRFGIGDKYNWDISKIKNINWRIELADEDLSFRLRTFDFNIIAIRDFIKAMGLEESKQFSGLHRIEISIKPQTFERPCVLKNTAQFRVQNPFGENIVKMYQSYGQYI